MRYSVSPWLYLHPSPRPPIGSSQHEAQLDNQFLSHHAWWGTPFLFVTCSRRCQVPDTLAKYGPRKQRKQRHQALAVVGAVGEPEGQDQQHDPRHDEHDKAGGHCGAGTLQQGAATSHEQCQEPGFNG